MKKLLISLLILGWLFVWFWSCQRPPLSNSDTYRPSSESDIADFYFGSNSTYTELWIDNGTSCDPANITVENLTPWAITSNFWSNKIYVLAPGEYTISSTKTIGNCTAIVWSEHNSVIIKSLITDGYLLEDIGSNSNFIIDTVSFDGNWHRWFNFSNGASPTTATHNITFFKSSFYNFDAGSNNHVFYMFYSNFIIKSSQVFNNAWGVFRSHNTINMNNVMVYDNWAVFNILPDYLSINNSQFFNNNLFMLGSYDKWQSIILINNTTIYNNSSKVQFPYSLSSTRNSVITLLINSEIFNNVWDDWDNLWIWKKDGSYSNPSANSVFYFWKLKLYTWEAMIHYYGNLVGWQQALLSRRFSPWWNIITTNNNTLYWFPEDFGRYYINNENFYYYYKYCAWHNIYRWFCSQGDYTEDYRYLSHNYSDWIYISIPRILKDLSPDIVNTGQLDLWFVANITNMTDPVDASWNSLYIDTAADQVDNSNDTTYYTYKNSNWIGEEPIAYNFWPNLKKQVRPIYIWKKRWTFNTANYVWSNPDSWTLNPLWNPDACGDWTFETEDIWWIWTWWMYNASLYNTYYRDEPHVMFYGTNNWDYRTSYYIWQVYPIWESTREQQLFWWYKINSLNYSSLNASWASINDTLTWISKFNICQIISYANGNLFIPSKTEDEFLSFYLNKPSWVVLTDCGGWIDDSWADHPSNPNNDNWWWAAIGDFM